MSDAQIKHLEIQHKIKDERMAALETALRTTRAIVSDAALNGFDPKAGDWAIRLFQNQAAITALVGVTIRED